MLHNGLRRSEFPMPIFSAGPAVNGQTKMALTLAQLFFVRNGKTDSVRTMSQIVENGTRQSSPISILIAPEGERRSRSNKSANFRNGLLAYRHRPSLNPKSYIIDQAEKMTSSGGQQSAQIFGGAQNGITGIILTENGHSPAADAPITRPVVSHLSRIPTRRILIRSSRNSFRPSPVRPAAHIAAGLEAARNLIQLDWICRNEKCSDTIS